MLAQFPDTTIPLVRKHVQPARRPNPGRVAALITQLDSRTFKTREAAEKELQDLGEQALAALRVASQDSLTLEAKRRLCRILKQLETPDAEMRRSIRAVALLRHFASSRSARQVLESISRAAPGQWLTQEAKAALASNSE
jgi:hypothetical protein